MIGGGALLGSVAGIVGTAIGAYSLTELKRLQALTTIQMEQMKIIIHKLKNHDSRIDINAEAITQIQIYLEMETRALTRVSAEIFLNTNLDTLFRRVEESSSDLISITAGLLDKRLDPRAIRSGTLREGLLAMGRQAEANQQKMMISSPLDALKSTTSFVSNELGFDVFVHIPMRSASEEPMRLYQLLPMRISIGGDAYLSFRDNTGSDVIAISPDESRFQIMSAADLSKCVQKDGKLYMCTGTARFTNTVQEDDPPACLYHLYKQNYAAVNLSCSKHISGPGSYAYALSDNEFIFSSVKSHRGNITCSDGRVQHFTVGLNTRIRVDAGCTIYSDSHMSWVGTSLQTQVSAVQYSWPDNVKELLQQKDMERWNEVMMLPGLRDPSLTADEILRRDDDDKRLGKLQERSEQMARQGDFSSMMGTAGMIIALFAFACAISFGIMWCWKMRKIQLQLINHAAAINPNGGDDNNRDRAVVLQPLRHEGQHRQPSRQRRPSHPPPGYDSDSDDVRPSAPPKPAEEVPLPAPRRQQQQVRRGRGGGGGGNGNGNGGGGGGGGSLPTNDGRERGYVATV